MNTSSARIHLSSIVPSVSLLVLISIGLCNCKEKDITQGAREQAAAARVEQIVALERSELIGSDGKIKLRILLTTSSEKGRTADFVSFLSKHFAKVETTEYKNVREEQAEDFDIVIIDYGLTRPGTLTTGYSRATVTVGVPGSKLCGGLRLKPGYL